MQQRYQVIIVEDDAMVSMLDRAFTEKDPRFQVAQTLSNGRDALHYLTAHPADLLILDMFMPGLTGLELLHELRARDVGVAVIMVTAAHDTQTLDALLKLGVTDYLVKPFTYPRFQQALDRFCQERETISHPSVSQSDIDRLLFPAPAPTADCGAPKGLQEKTLELLLGLLRQLGDQGGNSETVAAMAGLSAVTVRRYMRHLLETGQVEGEIRYDTGGRPSTVYRMK